MKIGRVGGKSTPPRTQRAERTTKITKERTREPAHDGTGDLRQKPKALTEHDAIGNAPAKETLGKVFKKHNSVRWTKREG